jgi:hypothetical protein
MSGLKPDANEADVTTKPTWVRISPTSYGSSRAGGGGFAAIRRGSAAFRVTGERDEVFLQC